MINKKTKTFEVIINPKDYKAANKLFESIGFKNPYGLGKSINKSIIYLVEADKKTYREMQGIEIVFDYRGCPRITIKELRKWIKKRPIKRT